jgi:murein DD-endopeptidase MepM/ murein hydrolase activator NlpD
VSFGLREHIGCAGETTFGAVTSDACSMAAAPPPAPEVRTLQVGARVTAWKSAFETCCHKLDLAPDLAEEIGSKRWFRGLGTMMGLCAIAIAMWPDFSAVEAATTVTAAADIRDEYRSQIIPPLVEGAESGRRMGVTALVVPIASAPERAMVQLTATLGQGDSFGRMLQRAGVGTGDAALVSSMVAATVPLGDIASGTRFDVTLGRRNAPGTPRSLDKMSFRARFDLAMSIERQAGRLVLTRQPIAVDAMPLRIRGTVGSSLYRSARAAGAPPKAIQQYLQTLDQHLSLEDDIAPEDKFDIIVAHKRAASGESETGNLMYAGLERNGKSRAQLMRWGDSGQFFEASGMGQQRAESAMMSPVAGRMTSGYGMRRHPILGYTRMHAGIDFGAPWGSPIHAVSDGVVAFAGRHGGHGNYVRLEHSGGLGTGYAHMSRIAVSPGTRVQAGQVIGYVGSTGLSTGPHLHYELYQNGHTVNPLSVRFTVSQQVDQQDLSAFKARLAKLLSVQVGAALGPLPANAPATTSFDTPQTDR